MLTTTTLILAALVLAVLAVVMALILGWANRAFHVEVDAKVSALEEALPGANCGGCGYVGCADYAEAVASGEAELTLCGPGGSGCIAAMAEIMGVDAGEALPYRAVVHCAATREQKLGRHPYLGEQTCASANLVADYQGCTYGCLGLGDCVAACDYDAIHIIDGVAVVDYEKCIGCKACARVCPRNIISMVPFKQSRMLVVACSNDDFGTEVKGVCTIGCIGCKACTKDNDLVTMDGNIPVIDYERYEPQSDLEPVLEKCRMESLIYVGEPSAADLDAVADEDIPERIKADFETSVDKTDWRG